MSNTYLIKGQIIHSEKMMKNTRENNKTSAPKNQIIIKTDDGDYQVAIWFQYLSYNDHFNKNNIFKLKETMSGWIVKEAIKEEDYKDE